MSEFGETLDDMDLEAFLNIRDWLESAITDKGGEITDAGIGLGRADLGFDLDGMNFGIQLKPRGKAKEKIGLSLVGEKSI